MIEINYNVNGEIILKVPLSIIILRIIVSVIFMCTPIVFLYNLNHIYMYLFLSIFLITGLYLFINTIIIIFKKRIYLIIDDEKVIFNISNKCIYLNQIKKTYIEVKTSTDSDGSSSTSRKLIINYYKNPNNNKIKKNSVDETSIDIPLYKLKEIIELRI